MSTRVQSITQLISAVDLSMIMDAAQRASSRRELRDMVGDNLSPPSVRGRYNALKVFWQWYLDGDVPADEPSVLAWHAFSDSQVRREILHVERCRHLGLLDGFICEVLYPVLGRGPLSLFPDEINEFPSPELNAYVTEHLPTASNRTRVVTRNKLRSLLVDANLVQRAGTDFQGTWHYSYYRPTWQAWLYGLYQEFGDNGQRQRSERYVVEESCLTRRFLLRVSTVSTLLAEAVRRGALEVQFFGGDRYVRLAYPDTGTMVRRLAAG